MVTFRPIINELCLPMPDAKGVDALRWKEFLNAKKKVWDSAFRNIDELWQERLGDGRDHRTRCDFDEEVNQNYVKGWVEMTQKEVHDWRLLVSSIVENEWKVFIDEMLKFEL